MRISKLQRISAAMLAASCLMFLTVGCEEPNRPSESTETTQNESSIDETTDTISGKIPTDTASAEGNSEVRGNIVIDGSSTVYPISEGIASQFGKLYPNVNVSVGQSGTGGGFKRFAKGETDVSDASRPIKASELEVIGEAGIDFVELPIAYDGLTIVAHKDNDFLDQLTVDELKKVFLADSAAKTWNEVRDDWPEEEIKIFAPGTDSGTFDYFKEVVAKDSELRSDMSTSEDDNVLVTGVAGSPYAIGFFGVAYYEENKDKLTSVSIVNPKTGEAVSPTAETIESGEYAPFSRPLFIYVKASSLRKPEVRMFANFYLENAPEMATHTGYVPLPTSVYDVAKAHLKGRKAGTHYLDANGEKRSGPVSDVYTEANLSGAE